MKDYEKCWFRRQSQCMFERIWKKKKKKKEKKERRIKRKEKIEIQGYVIRKIERDFEKRDVEKDETVCLKTAEKREQIK